MASGVATTTVNTAVMAVGYPVYLHFLGYEKYGVWLVLSTVLTFAQLGNLGLGPAVMKLVAEEHGRRDTAGIQRYVTTALALLGLSGTLVLAAIILFRGPIITLFGLTDENARTALWLLPYIGALSLYVFVVQVFEATLSGLGRMDLANYRGVLARVTNVSVSSLLLFLGYGVGSLLVGRITAEVLTHLVLWLSIRRLFGLRLLRPDGLDIARGKRLLSFGGMVFGGSLLNMLFSPFNKLILSRYVGVAAVPVYEIALTGSMQIRGLITAACSALIPEISRISAQTTVQARDRVSDLCRRSLKVVLFLGVPVFAGLAVFAPMLLRLWLGDRFVETLPGVFRIMLMGVFVSVLGIPASNTLMGTGHVRSTFMANILLATVNTVAILCALAMLQVTVTVVACCSSVAMGAMVLFLILQKKHMLNNWPSHEEYPSVHLIPSCANGA